MQKVEEEAQEAWDKTYTLPNLVEKKVLRYLEMEPRIPLSQFRPPPFRSTPPLLGGTHGPFITPAELSALPAHIRASFEREEFDMSVLEWERGRNSA
uniref:Uncharacterized protein n=1 Tax=Haptolina brevifila TaxID=156173 RepID=A0A7S2GD61_9EUKA